MPGGRPPGPLRRYDVEFVAPADPSQRYQGAVRDANEETARTSVTGLRDLRFAFQVKMRFLSAASDQKLVGGCLAAEWDRLGRVTFQHAGEFKDYIPGWVTGREPLVKEKQDEPVSTGS